MKRDLHCAQSCNHACNRGGVCLEGSIVLDVEVNLFIVKVLWVWHVVCGERELQQLTRAPSGGEFTESELNNYQRRSS